jgi:DNA-binding MarR family transcriptional regulator
LSAEGISVKRGEARDETRVVLEALRGVVQALRSTARAAERRHGLSAAQLFVLHLLERDGPASVNELAQRSFTHQSSVSVVVSRLAQAGLIVRDRSTADRRRASVSLTARGRAAVRRAPEPAQARLVVALERMTPARRRALARGLAALVRGMGVAGETAGMFFEDGAGRRSAAASRGAAES